MKKKLFACLECGFVEKLQLIEQRIDIKEVFHNTPPFPSRTREQHGIKVLKICSHCGVRKLIEFKSDCNIGRCGIKKIYYAGGGFSTKKKCECNNTYSYKT